MEPQGQYCVQQSIMEQTHRLSIKMESNLVDRAMQWSQATLGSIQSGGFARPSKTMGDCNYRFSLFEFISCFCFQIGLQTWSIHSDLWAKCMCVIALGRHTGKCRSNKDNANGRANKFACTNQIRAQTHNKLVQANWLQQQQINSLWALHLIRAVSQCRRTGLTFYSLSILETRSKSMGSKCTPCLLACTSACVDICHIKY